MKNNRLTVRFFCLLLSLCTLCAVFCACATEDADKTLTDASEASVESNEDPTEGAPTDEEGYLLLESIPEDFKIGGEFKILGWGDGAQHYRAEETDDVVGNAIYKRNMTVEETLGVDLQWSFSPGNWDHKEEYIQQVKSTSDAGMAYDALVCYNLVPYALAVNGLAENLYDTAYIDLTAPWWPSVYLGEALYNETIFGLVEGCAYATMRQMTGIFFNNDLIEDKNLRSPYDMVAANEWTLDNMMVMIKDTYEDRNSNGKKDGGDFYGASTGYSPQVDGWFYGMGYRWSEFDGDGNLTLLAGDPSIIEFTDRMAEAFSQQDFYGVDDNRGDLFKASRAILYMESVTLADTTLKDQEIRYGIVPAPKKNAEQERYYTHLTNRHDAWCIPLNAKDNDNSSAVIECMAYESYRHVDPVYYDACIKLRYASDERLGEMYDLMRDSITFDFFYLFGASFSKFPIEPMRFCCQMPDQYSWSSIWQQYSATWKSEFDNIVSLYGGSVK
ncbi:MAG: hypothetical protein E7629_02570 [Ruminococcaceae bacterium]|nr:hypothetical protein [Oscillospiraceae bacterium]